MFNREFKYLHANSEHLKLQGATRTKFRVHLSQPIKNTRNVGLKSLTTPNTGYNIDADDNVLSWLEVWRNPTGNATQVKKFSYTLTTGYYTHTELLAHLQGGIDSIPVAQRRFSSAEQRLELGWSQTTNTNDPITAGMTEQQYKTKVQVFNNANKLFAPFVNTTRSGHPSTLWKRLGFTEDQLVFRFDASGTNRIAYVGAGMIPIDLHEWGTSSATTNPAPEVFYVANQAVAGNDTRLISKNVATIENHAGIFVQCDLSIDSCFETHARHGLHIAEKSKILDWIPNSSARNSYIHHNRETPTLHRLHQDEVADIEISIHDIDGKLLGADQIPHFTMCLMFECEIPDDPQVQETQQLIASSAYRRNHPTSVFPRGL